MMKSLAENHLSAPSGREMIFAFSGHEQHRNDGIQPALLAHNVIAADVDGNRNSEYVLVAKNALEREGGLVWLQ